MWFWFWFEGPVGGSRICGGGSVLLWLFGSVFLTGFGGWRGGGYCDCGGWCGLLGLCVCVCVCVLGSYGQFLAIFGVVVWLLFLGFYVFFPIVAGAQRKREKERKRK